MTIRFISAWNGYSAGDVATLANESALISAGIARLSYESDIIAEIGILHHVVLAVDVVNDHATANTIADVTGLSFDVRSGEMYQFDFLICYAAAATTTGSRWSVNGPADPALLSYISEYALTATSKTVNNAIAYDIPAASNTTSAATSGNIAIITGFIKPSVDGTVIARFASEVTASAITAKAGSLLTWQRVA